MVIDWSWSCPTALGDDERLVVPGDSSGRELANDTGGVLPGSRACGVALSVEVAEWLAVAAGLWVRIVHG